MVHQIVLLAVALLTTASYTSTVNICGAPLENTMANGDVIVTNPKNAADDYACCNQYSAEPHCVAFVEGGEPDELACQLLSYAYSLPSTLSILLPKGYLYTTVFINGRGAPNWSKRDGKNGFKGCNSGFYCQPGTRISTSYDAYTFVKNVPDGHQCYLKSSTVGRQTKTGVMSGRIVQPEVAAWAKCGDTKKHTGECPSGYYCQPWDVNYHQCIPNPAPQCIVSVGVDYYGNDLKRVAGLNPGTCCDECTKTTGCNAYTFVNNAPDGRQCCLKSAIDEKKASAGVISGIIVK